MVDVYGAFAVVSSTAAWIELHKASIIQSLYANLALKQVIWRASASMLQLDGFNPAGPEAKHQVANAQGSTANGKEL